jgi:hypothetical protein
MKRWTQRPPGSNWGDFGEDDEISTAAMLGARERAMRVLTDIERLFAITPDDETECQYAQWMMGDVQWMMGDAQWMMGDAPWMMGDAPWMMGDAPWMGLVSSE